MNEVTFIIIDFLGLLLSMAYFAIGQKNSAMLTLLISLLMLVKITWVRYIGMVLLGFIAICFILFRTRLGALLLSILGLDHTGRRKRR